MILVDQFVSPVNRLELHLGEYLGQCTLEDLARRARPDREDAALRQMLARARQSGGRVERPVARVEKLIGGVVDVDEDGIVQLPRRVREVLEDVAFFHPKPWLGAQHPGEGNEVTRHPVDYLREKLEHLDCRDVLARECRMGRVAEAEAADENIELAAAMPFERDCCQRGLGFGVVAAHQEFVVEGHLGDDCPGSRQELSSSQTQYTEFRLAVLEDLQLRRRAHWMTDSARILSLADDASGVKAARWPRDRGTQCRGKKDILPGWCVSFNPLAIGAVVPSQPTSCSSANAVRATRCPNSRPPAHRNQLPWAHRLTRG